MLEINPQGKADSVFDGDGLRGMIVSRCWPIGEQDGENCPEIVDMVAGTSTGAHRGRDPSGCRHKNPTSKLSQTAPSLRASRAAAVYARYVCRRETGY